MPHHYLEPKPIIEYLHRCEICGDQKICKQRMICVNGKTFNAKVCKTCEKAYKVENVDPGKR